MEEALVSFGTAKLAKEKLYPQERFKYPKYSTDGYVEYHNCNDGIQVPTQSELQKWLRESHKINVIPTMSRFSRTYGYKIYYIEDGKIEVIDCQYIKNNSFEEAFETGLQNGLELIEVKP